MNVNMITNVVGAIGAASMAAQPVLNGVTGSLHQGDYFQLFSAVMFAVISYFTGKK